MPPRKSNRSDRARKSTGHRRNDCACGCGQTVAPSTERRHLAGKGAPALSNTVLAQNEWLASGDKRLARKRARDKLSEFQVETSRTKRVRTHSPAPTPPSVTSDQSPEPVVPPHETTNDLPVHSPQSEAEHVSPSESGDDGEAGGPSSLDGGSVLQGWHGSGDIDEGRNEWEDEDGFEDLEEAEDDEEEWFAETAAELGREGIPMWDILGEHFDIEVARIPGTFRSVCLYVRSLTQE